MAVEWENVRHLIAAYAGDVAGASLLEFGCNYGASSIVAAALGARVTGIDVEAEAVALARLNAARLLARVTGAFGLSIGMAGSSFSAAWRKPFDG